MVPRNVKSEVGLIIMVIKKSKKHKYTVEEQKFIQDNYMTMSYSDIAIQLGLDTDNVRAWALKHLGIKKQQRNFNRQYFKNITTPSQAYWLGFIFADGWVCASNNNHELGIQLQLSDIKHLQKFSKELNDAFQISTIHREQLIPGNKNISVTDSCILRVYSKEIVEDLIHNGVVLNKTYSSTYPVVSQKLFFDFLRGYIDGDGCIYVSKNNKSLQVHITSANNSVLEYIQQQLEQYEISSKIYQESERKYRIYINGQYACKLCTLLYRNTDNHIRLERKYDKYMTYKLSLPAEKSA